MRGIVEMYQPKRQFGFVRADNGEKYFFHRENCAAGFNPQLGARVEFQIAPPYILGKPDQAIDLRNMELGAESDVEGAR